MRQSLIFACRDDTLRGALDGIDGETGLLIVSGGNETMSGAHAGMSVLAARIAAAGYPVFRFDRRGVGDSSGDNRGYLASADDIAAAAGAFRTAMPGLKALVAFGNCDAATALALFHPRIDADALVLANPWLIEGHNSLPPPAAIRARYREKLTNPREWLRLLRGGVDIRKLLRGLARLREKPQVTGIAPRFRDALSQAGVPVRIILARRDVTARVFADHWARADFAPLRERIPLHALESNSHGFSRNEDADALFALLVETLSGASRDF